MKANFFSRISEYFSIIFVKISQISISPFEWILSFTAMVILRLGLEAFFNQGGIKLFPVFIFHLFTQSFFYFLIIGFCFVLISRWILRFSFREAFNIFLSGMFFYCLLAPILDEIISRGQGFWGFYEFGGLAELGRGFVTFFGVNPEIGITPGPRIVSFLFVIIFFFYGLFRTKNWWRSWVATFLVYVIFFIFGSFPSWVTILTSGFSKGFFNVSEMDVVQMFLVPLRLFSSPMGDVVIALVEKLNLIYPFLFILLGLIVSFLIYPRKTGSFLANMRLPQIIYHTGLFFVGIIMSAVFAKAKIDFSLFEWLAIGLSVVAICLSWIASVVVNDLADEKIDKETNPGRPLIVGTFSRQEYVIWGSLCFLLALWFSSLVSFKITLLLIVYQALAWIYSAHPFRLKRFLYVGTFVSSLASLTILFAGYILVSPNQSLEFLPGKIILFLIFAYTVSLPLKDFKDKSGDEKDGVYTVPVVFGDYWGRVLVGVGIFISYLLSVVLINERSLLWWAIFFGGVSFWIVENKKTNPRDIFWWILGLVFLYGCVLFLKVLV